MVAISLASRLVPDLSASVSVIRCLVVGLGILFFCSVGLGP